MREQKKLARGYCPKLGRYRQEHSVDKLPHVHYI